MCTERLCVKGTRKDDQTYVRAGVSGVQVWACRCVWEVWGVKGGVGAARGVAPVGTCVTGTGRKF